METRSAGGLWKKGVSGNPNGRPKQNNVVKGLAREHSAEAIARLVANLDHENGSVANQAAIALLDRGYGKPAQAIVGDDEHDAISMRTIVTGVPRTSDDTSND